MLYDDYMNRKILKLGVLGLLIVEFAVIVGLATALTRHADPVTQTYSFATNINQRPAYTEWNVTCRYVRKSGSTSDVSYGTFRIEGSVTNFQWLRSNICKNATTEG